MYKPKLRFRILAAILAVLTLLAIATSAQAAAPTAGDKVVVPLGSKSTGLRAGGVKLRAISPAKLSSKSLTLEISDVSMPKPGAGQLILRGGLRLSKGKRKVEIKGFLVSVTATSVKFTAKLGGTRFTVFSVKKGGSNSLDAGTTSIKLSTKRLSLGASAAKAIKKALSLKSYKPKALGTLTGGATAYYPPIKKDPIGGGPADQQLWDEPPLPTRPGTAVDATSPPLQWWSRDSWVNYVGQAPSVYGGATSLGVVYNDPSQGSPAHACPSGSMQAVSNVYGFSLPFTGGWWDAASGTGMLNYGGGARFYYPGRFDMSLGYAELVITPAGTTMNMRVIDADYPDGRRAHLFNVNTMTPLAGGPFGPGGPAALLQNHLTQVGSTGPFGGMYGTNLDWGCINAQFGV
jgi:hypothetical protein